MFEGQAVRWGGIRDRIAGIILPCILTARGDGAIAGFASKKNSRQEHFSGGFRLRPGRRPIQTKECFR
jgi:hypothetical protein